MRAVVVDNGNIYVTSSLEGGTGPNTPTPPASVYAVNASTGSRLWTRQFSAVSDDCSPPFVSTGTVYFYCFVEKTLYAVQAQSGTTLWSKEIEGTRSPIAVANGVLYIAVTDYLMPNSTRLSYALLALDASNGSMLWHHPYNLEELGVIQGVMYISNGVMYSDSSSNIYAFKASDGNELWLYQFKNAKDEILAVTVVPM